MPVWKNRFAGHLGLRAPDAPLFRHLGASVDPVDQINFMADLGFAGVEDNYLTLREPKDQARIGEAVARRGMEMGSFVHDPLNYNQPTWTRLDEEGRAALAEAFATSMAAARRAGSRYLNCVTGFDGQRTRAKQIEGMVRNLERFADDAAEAGVVICVEATNAPYLTGMLIEDVTEAVGIVNELDHPAVKLMFDIGHIGMNGQDIPAAVDIMASRIGMVQAVDISADNTTRIDLGAGTLDCPLILRHLRACGYTGLIEIEHVPLDDSAAGERALIARLEAVDAAS
jgi:hydroxypyruvate isomerase